MFRSYSPGATLFSLVVAGFMSLIKPSRKIVKQTPDSSPSPYLDRVRKVVVSHADCTAEIFNIFVSGARKVRIFSELTPGDRVELRLRNGDVSVYADGEYMDSPLLSDSSRLHSLLESNADVEAFLGGRDATYCTDEAEFCSIVAFYKIKGVPPTDISVE
ncbi:MAG: hypothetical protein K2M87_00925 [Muribaculaceae bacterium]|nr:hypothetical protein [Muribaculaceae bacterium]